MKASEIISDVTKEYTDDWVDAMAEAKRLLELTEQGLIVELPVPIGNCMYRTYYGSIEPCYFTKEDIPEVLMLWGIRYFATREEAEQRSKEMRGEK